MEQYNMHEAKSQLSRLVNKAEKGERVVISKNGKPVAILTKYDEPKKPRLGGQWKGKVKIAPDFDDFSPEMEDMFGLDGN